MKKFTLLVSWMNLAIMAQSFDKFNLANEGIDWLFKLLNLVIVDIDCTIVFVVLIDEGSFVLNLFDVDSFAICC